jgi:cytochrome c-type biogenesis protein CcmF
MNRWKDLHADLPMNSVLSREALFLVNNLLFLSVLVICLWGVLFPLISELVTGTKVTVGPPFYERAITPLLGVLIILMAVTPQSAWGRSTVKTLSKGLWLPVSFSIMTLLILMISGLRNWISLVGFTLISLVIFVTLYEFIRGVSARVKAQEENPLIALGHLIRRNRRRYGGYIIHVAMVVMAVGIIGIEVFQTTTQKSLSVGESLQLAGYNLSMWMADISPERF